MLGSGLVGAQLGREPRGGLERILVLAGQGVCGIETWEGWGHGGQREKLLAHTGEPGPQPGRHRWLSAGTGGGISGCQQEQGNPLRDTRT